MNPATNIRKALPQLIKVLNENDINYWLDFGTLLGAIRDKDVIEWDLDGDLSYVYTPEECVKILGCVHPVLNRAPMGQLSCFWDGGIKFLMSKGHIDLYPWLKGPVMTEHPQKCFGIGPWPTSDIAAGFTYIDFLGVKARIPINYKARLSRLYGNWKVPVAPHLRNKPYWENK